MDISRAMCCGCGRRMTITRVYCPNCDVSMDGEFDVSAFAELSLEDQTFVAAFLRHHGSIKKMEELFGISYPTVKNRLNAVAGKLDAAFSAPEEPAVVLDRLARGEITVDEALEMVKDEVRQGLLAVQRVTPVVRGPTVAEGVQRAVMEWQLDLLQLMWMMDRVGYGRRDLTDRYREQYGENIVLPLTGMEITEPACRTLCSYLRAGRVLIQEVGGRPKLNPEYDPATLLGLVGSIALPDNRKPAV